MTRQTESLIVVVLSAISLLLLANNKSIDIGMLKFDLLNNNSNYNNNYNYSNNGRVETTGAMATTTTSATAVVVDTKSSSETSLMSENDRKPWMVVHVGPPKTGTSTLQSGLAKFSSELATLDNVFYVGQLMKDRKQVTYFDHRHNNSNSNNSTANNNTTNLDKTKKTFWMFQMKDFAPGTHPPNITYFQALKTHRDQKHNVVLSSEHYTSKFPRSNPQILFKNIFDYTFLKEGGPKRIRRRNKKQNGNVTSLLTEDLSPTFGFDVTIVVAYRHYFQWLPSYYYQSVLINGFKKRNKPTLVEYIETTLNKLGDEYFFGAGDDDNDNDNDSSSNISNNETKNNNNNNKSKRKPWSHTRSKDLDKNHGSLYSYFMWSSPVSLRHRVELFDMHQQQLPFRFSASTANNNNNNNNSTTTTTNDPDLLRDFVCGALSAEGTCSHLEDASNAPLVKRVRVTAGTSGFETGVLSSTQRLQLRDAGIERLGKKLQTSQIEKRFRDWAEHGGGIHHRQLCLEDNSIQLLGAVSWNMLKHLEFLVRSRNEIRLAEAPAQQRGHKLPLLLSPGDVSEGNRDDESWWIPIKKDHDELFLETVESGGYCDLDLDRLFADPVFVKAVFPGS